MNLRTSTIYDWWAPAYDLSRLPFAWFTRTVHRALDRALGALQGGRRVLDLGAGTGFIFRRLVSLDRVPNVYVGVEPSPRMLARVGRLTKGGKPQAVRLVCAEAEASLDAFERHGERFDLVVSSLLLAHLATPETTVSRAMGVLSNGGTACFLFFARDGMPLLRPVVWFFLRCLGGKPVDVAALSSAMEHDSHGNRRGHVEEQRGLGGCLVLLSLSLPQPAVKLARD